MKILQADDHALFREGVKYLLKQLDGASLQVLSSSDYTSTVAAIRRHPDLDLLLLDLDMPGMDGGLPGVARIVNAHPALPVVVLSASESSLHIDRAMQIGVAGYVPKSSPADILLAALKLVLAGGIYAPRTANGAAPEQLQGGSLTDRQRQILAAMAQGMSNKAIADRLFLSESTVKGHARIIFQILAVDNRVQAINKARQWGIVPA